MLKKKTVLPHVLLPSPSLVQRLIFSLIFVHPSLRSLPCIFLRQKHHELFYTNSCHQNCKHSDYLWQEIGDITLVFFYSCLETIAFSLCLQSIHLPAYYI